MSELLTEPAKLAGFLEKKAGLRFKKKYLELIGDKLLVSPEKHAGNRQKYDSLRVLTKDCFIGDAESLASGFSFILVFPSNPSDNLLLRTATEKERGMWVGHLMKAIRKAQRQEFVMERRDDAKVSPRLKESRSKNGLTPAANPPITPRRSPRPNKNVQRPKSPINVTKKTIPTSQSVTVDENFKRFTIDDTPLLKDILEQAPLLESFKNYLEDTFCQENILFYLEADEYKKIMGEQERRAKFLHIVNRFLVDGAEFEMDFADARRQELLECIENPGPNVLENLKWDVFTVMTRDCVPKYVLSSQYKVYISEQPESARVAASRLKLEEFFGEPLVGPLCRIELITRRRRGDKLTKQRRKWVFHKYGNVRLGHANDNMDALSAHIQNHSR